MSLSEQIVSALLGGFTGLLAGFLGAYLQYRAVLRLHSSQLSAEETVKRLLSSADWEKRTFQAIKDRLGGFADDDLRRILVGAGAVRFRSRDGEELWGLVDRNRQSL